MIDFEYTIEVHDMHFEYACMATSISECYYSLLLQHNAPLPAPS